MDPHLHVFTDTHRITIGAIYLGLSVIILPIHLLFLSLFIIHDDYRCCIAYNIMLSIGIAECLQLIGHLYAGIALIVDNHSYEFIEELAGNITNAAWIALIPQTLVLALNRYTVFRRHKSSHAIIFKSMIGCCWIYGFLYFIVYMTPFTGLIFDETCYCWSYNDGPWSTLVGHFEYYSLAPIMILTFIVHVIIVIIIAYMRSSLTSNKGLYEKNEMKLLIQSFIMFLYPTFLLFGWHYGSYFLPNSLWTSIAINVLWIIFCGLNPFLYFTMNNPFLNMALMNSSNKKNSNTKLEKKKKEPQKI